MILHELTDIDMSTCSWLNRMHHHNVSSMTSFWWLGPVRSVQTTNTNGVCTQKTMHHALTINYKKCWQPFGTQQNKYIQIHNHDLCIMYVQVCLVLSAKWKDTAVWWSKTSKFLLKKSSLVIEKTSKSQNQLTSCDAFCPNVLGWLLSSGAMPGVATLLTLQRIGWGNPPQAGHFDRKT